MPKTKVALIKIMSQAFLLLATSFIASCSSLFSGAGGDYTISSTIKEDRTLTQSLNQAAQSVSKSLSELEKTQLAVHPTKMLNQPPVTSYGLDQKISLNWDGPIEPLIEKICQMSNFNMRKLGIAPEIPVIVSIHVNNKSLADIVSNAGLQAGKNIDVVVYPSTKTIALRYHHN